MVKLLQEWTKHGHFTIHIDQKETVGWYEVLHQAIISSLQNAANKMLADWHSFMVSLSVPDQQPHVGYVKIAPLDLAHLSSS